MYECRKCEQFGLTYKRAHRPQEYIEGNRDSTIWIVGLNPAFDSAWVDGVDVRTTRELQEYFDIQSGLHSYFRDFKAVSKSVYHALGKTGGIAHTDLVKCQSNGWPPSGCTDSSGKTIIENCMPYFVDQLRRVRPLMIICNGVPICDAMKKLVPIPAGCSPSVTSYITEFEEKRICIVLSGFIGRIDNYAKRRLGAEIEERAKELLLLS